jgi:ribosomal protein L27
MSLGVDEWIFALTDGLVAYSAPDYDAMSQLRW